MRVVVGVIAALLTLGLAAFGIAATQNASGPVSLAALAAHIVSPAQSTAAPPAPIAAASRSSPAAIRSRTRHPVAAERAIRLRNRRRPEYDGVGRSGARAARPTPAAASAGEPGFHHDHAAVQQSRCARPLPHRPNRHDRRPRIRHRALQAVRLPARQGDRADVRRRPVAGEYADGAQGAAGQLPEGDLLRDRRARDVGSATLQGRWAKPE